MSYDFNRIEFAKYACAELTNKREATIDLAKRYLKHNYTNDLHTQCRKVLLSLERRGVVLHYGKGKFKWDLVNKAYDKENPFKTPLVEKTDPLSHLTARTDGDKVWLIGSTYDHKELLKKVGCHWDMDKKAWYGDNTPYIKVQLVALGVKIEGIDVPASAAVQVVSDEVENELKALRKRCADLDERLANIEAVKKVEITMKQVGKKEITLKEKVHPIFEQVMFHVNCGDNVMLVGPRGCGKTHLCGQVADLLGRSFNFLSLSGGVTEGKIFGRVTPNINNGKSEFNSTPFVDSFEKGGVFLLDEVDAADPNVLLSLNSALANGQLAVDRAKNPVIGKHKEFVCMAAANTWGNGANRQYVGRNQQDSAFTERFVQIEMDYDAALERSLCPGADELVTKLQGYRAAIAANRLERTCSTRFILRAYTWLQHGKDLEYVDKMFFAGWRNDEISKVKGHV